MFPHRRRRDASVHGGQLGGGSEQVGTDHHLVVGVEATKGVTERRRLGVTPTAWNIATEPTEAAARRPP